MGVVFPWLIPRRPAGQTSAPPVVSRPSPIGAPSWKRPRPAVSVLARFRYAHTRGAPRILKIPAFHRHLPRQTCVSFREHRQSRACIHWSSRHPLASLTSIRVMGWISTSRRKTVIVQRRNCGLCGRVFALVKPPDENETEQDKLCPACLKLPPDARGSDASRVCWGPSGKARSIYRRRATREP